MSRRTRSLGPAQAAAILGVSAKALRLYERHGLLMPDRSRRGWRLYGPDAMARAAEIVALRALGLGLAQIARVIDGGRRDRDAGLAEHETCLHERARRLGGAIERLRALRADIRGRPADRRDRGAPPAVGFALPWPWDGEGFALHDLPPLAFITGPLGSGKTRFARALAAALPDAAFLGPDRRDAASAQRLAASAERTLDRLVSGGAERSDALATLVAALEAETPAVLVIDMVEDGLSEETQRALMAHLRLRGSAKRALFLMTRSSSILDIGALGHTETVILCPANHAPPIQVVPYPGGRGYESVTTCLAPPAVRARSAGVVAVFGSPP